MAYQKTYIPLIIGIAIAIGVFIGNTLNYNDTSDRLFTSNSKKDKLNRLIDYIDYEYIDQINTDSIVDVTVNEILDNLDPHSVYIPKHQLQQVTDNMKGDFVGIGLTLFIYKDTLTVINTIESGPSDCAGIKAGDRILMANKDTIFGQVYKKDSIYEKLKGAKNSNIEIAVYRKETQKHLTFNVIRADIPIKSVIAAYMVTPTLGYIKINRFAESTYTEFKMALNRLQKQGAIQLALDLRDNPGGFLSVAEEIVDEFLEDNKLILFTKNKTGKIEKRYATRRGSFEKGDVYVLINEKSASASEIVAGALQDNDKGTIVGRRSYGKGLVQREMTLGDGSAIRLTVSKYYTPTGRSIQKPYLNGKNNDYYNDYNKRLANGELDDKSQIEIVDSLKFTTPKGKIVYGGGGIIPDVFVPINSNGNIEALNYIASNGLISDFIFEELDAKRSLYKNLIEKDSISRFQVSNDMLKRFKKYAKTNKISLSSTYEPQIKQLLKVSLLQQLYNSNTYYKYINEDDAMLEKVKALIASKTKALN